MEEGQRHELVRRSVEVKLLVLACNLGISSSSRYATVSQISIRPQSSYLRILPKDMMHDLNKETPRKSYGMQEANDVELKPVISEGKLPISLRRAGALISI